MAINGVLITLEGPDGLGKSFQGDKLVESLRRNGHVVHYTKEPGTETMGSPFGPLVRDVLFRKTVQIPPGADQLFLLTEHIHNVGLLSPHLENGEIVICDRYVDSAHAYAIVHTEPTPQSVLDLWDKFQGPEPDITILLVAMALDDDQKPTCSGMIGWALDRARKRTGSEATKQGGKVWNDYPAQVKVQMAYLERLLPLARTLIVPIYEHDSPEVVHQRLMKTLTPRLDSLLAERRQSDVSLCA
jgi:thymidylate kinase